MMVDEMPPGADNSPGNFANVSNQYSNKHSADTGTCTLASNRSDSHHNHRALNLFTLSDTLTTAVSAVSTRAEVSPPQQLPSKIPYEIYDASEGYPAANIPAASRDVVSMIPQDTIYIRGVNPSMDYIISCY